MNPQSAAMPSTPKVVNDVSAPAAAPASAVPAAALAQTIAQAPPAADIMPVTSGPNIVSNIPVHAAAPPASANEDEELDKIMHDVGQELKKEENKPSKHGMLSFLHHEPKPLVKVNNQGKQPMVTVPASNPAAGQPAPVPQAAPLQPTGVPVATVQPAAVPAAAKPKSQRSMPVFVIFVTILATGFLIAAAIAAYRQT